MWYVTNVPCHVSVLCVGARDSGGTERSHRYCTDPSFVRILISLFFRRYLTLAVTSHCLPRDVGILSVQSTLESISKGSLVVSSCSQLVVMSRFLSPHRGSTRMRDIGREPWGPELASFGGIQKLAVLLPPSGARRELAKGGGHARGVRALSGSGNPVSGGTGLS